MKRCVFLAGLLSCVAFFSQAAHITDANNQTTLNTMPPDQALEVMLYLKNHSDKDFVNQLLQRSKDEMSLPAEWEKFIVDEIKNHNQSIIYSLSRISGENLYNYLSYKNQYLFMRSNLLFSFIINMYNCGPKSAKTVLKKENYQQIKAALLKALDVVITSHSKNRIAKTNKEKIAYFLSYSFVNLSYPSLALIDKALSAAKGAPQEKMWTFAASDDFYRTLNHVIQAEILATEDDWKKVNAYQEARNLIIGIAHDGYDMMQKMIGSSVLRVVETLDTSFDRAQASYMLASLYVMAFMVEYAYVGNYFDKAYQESLPILANMPDEVAEKMLKSIRSHMSLIAQEDDENPLLKSLMHMLKDSL